MFRIKILIIRLRELIKNQGLDSPAAKASFWFVISNIVLKGISFITTPIFTRLMEVKDYGTTSVFVSWESVINIFATLSLSGGVYNIAMAKYEKDIDTFTSSMIGLTICSSLFIYTIVIIFNWIYPPFFHLDNSYLIFMWIQTFATSASSFWIMRKRYIYDYKKVIIFTFFNALTCPIMAIIAVNIFPEHKAIAKIIGAGLPSIIVGLCFMYEIIRQGKTIVEYEYWIYALKFNVPLLPHYMSSVILTSSDKLMLNGMVGTAEAGIYAIANSIIGLVSLVTQSINHSLIPYTLQSIKNEKLKGLYKSVFSCSILISIICMFIVLFAREGILIFATKEYIKAALFIAPLSFSVQMSFVSGILGNIIFYYEKTSYMSAMTMICGAINIILNYYGIKKFGFIAVGYTTMICSLLRLLLYYLCARKFENNLSQIVQLRFIFTLLSLFALIIIYSIIFQDKIIYKMGLIIIIMIIIYRFNGSAILNFIKL